MISNFGNFFTAKLIPFRCNNNVGSTQIAAQNLRGFLRFWWRRFKLDIQIVSTIFALTQSRCFRLVSLQQSDLVVADSQVKSLSTIDSCQTYRPVFLPEGKGTGIVSRAGRGKTPNWFTVLFSRLPVARNPSNRVDSQLSRKPKFSPDIVINQGLDRQLIHQSWLYSFVHVSASSSKRPKSSVNFGGLFGCYLEFAGYCQDLLHEFIVSQYVKLWQEQGICSSRHPSAHLPRASLDGLWADGILTSREFLPPLTNIASTLVVQRGTPSVRVDF